MRRLSRLIPFWTAVLVLLTALLLALLTGSLGYWYLKKDLQAYARYSAALLGRTLVEPLRHEDIWRSYELVQSFTRLPAGAPSDRPLLVPTRVIVLDRFQQLVAAQPMDGLSVGERVTLPAPLGQLEDGTVWLKGTATQLRLIAPIMDNRALMGLLWMEYDKGPFWARLQQLWLGLALLSLLILLVLIPLAVRQGRRLAEPLEQLSRCIAQLDLTWQETRCELPVARYEEMATLTRTFSSMLDDLREKARLQEQITHSERMAAVGRLAGTIAHEINNPLGGMLNLVNTMKRFDTQLSDTSRQSLEVLERGLLQIRDIVAALLVEAKLDDRPFRADDIQDVLQLVESEARRRQIEVHSEGESQVAFERWGWPATKLRQVLLNLLLNAVRAAPQGSAVVLAWHDKGTQAALTVENAIDPDHFDAARIAQAFEPDLDQSRSGLGLWVTYLIVTQLGGKLVWHHGGGRLSMIVTFTRSPDEQNHTAD